MELFTNAPKTYASRANAIKAIEKTGYTAFKYVIAVNEAGRFFPVVIGNDAINAGSHFHHCTAN